MIVGRGVFTRRKQPDPPVNLCATWRDGRSIPLECVYVGKPDGFDHWKVTLTLGTEWPDEIVADAMPENSALEVALDLQLPPLPRFRVKSDKGE